ncbi:MULTISPECIES: PDR/VanB family oxidoreductase [unclassified Geodermatophilus]|uniref:PDR/VanB family oxidoreductase n=1 Tax=unclassified Geodermatophilus TaxID=2637632 RepID=UPI003EEE7C75
MVQPVPALLDRPDGQLTLVVRELRREAEGVVSIVLELPDGGELPTWQPGSHVDLVLPGMVRQYSLCGSPDDRQRYRLGVLREPNSRGGSAHVHEQLAVGDAVEVRGPRNRFPLVKAPRYVFVAGGIGITPLLPMIAEVAGRGADWTLVYGGRCRSSMAFLPELATYGDRVQLRPQDEFGLLDLDAVCAEAGDAVVYCCGPEPLIAALEAVCGRRGTELHLERFTARQVGPDLGLDRFQVQCADSDLTVTVAEQESILDALIAAGVDVNYDCREGTCGSCELDVLDGEVAHRDSVYTAAEHASMSVVLPCVSRALCDRIVLDV